MAELDEKDVAVLLSGDPPDEPATEREYRNGALNPAASQRKPTSYAHATSDSLQRSRVTFFATCPHHALEPWFG